MAAGADSVSAELAALFGAHGQMYQALSNQAALFHSQFVQLMNAGGAQYALSEAANASPLASAAGEAGNTVAAPVTPGRPISGDVPLGAAGGRLFANAGNAGSGGAGGRGGLLASAGAVSLGSNAGVANAGHVSGGTGDTADAGGPGGPGGLLWGDSGYGALGGAGALAAAGVPLGIGGGAGQSGLGSSPAPSAGGANGSGMQAAAGGKTVASATVAQPADGGAMDTSLRQSADWSRARTPRDRSAG
ncbi:hypothetical protein A5791_12065 [Mycobacterium sp. 852002-51163_SCH5372311]|nr:hypothetical protein A5791_12065 [Mycobacterium sp. 852002-51163_SCH5372311]